MAYKGPAKAKLVEAVNEISKVMGYNPVIEVGQTNQKLFDEIGTSLSDIEENDRSSFSDSAWETILVVARRAKDVPVWAVVVLEPDNTDTESGEGSEDTTSDAKTKTEDVVVEDDKSLIDNAGEEKKSDKKTSAKKPPSKRFTRSNATIEAIESVCKKGGTSKEIILKANDIYVKHGGASSAVNKINNVPTAMLLALVAFGVLTLEDGVYKLA